MRIENYQFPKSSFLSINKDLDIIVSRILKNERLQKLLYYPVRNALDQKNLTEDQQMELLEKNIKIVPKMPLEPSVLAYVVIEFDNFRTNDSNPEFRDNSITFSIICNYDQWLLNDFNLRPYRIAGEIDSMFNNTRLTGIGKLEFIGANQSLVDDNFGCLQLTYAAIHGEEDKKGMLNPREEAQFIKDFNEMYNS